MRAWVFCATIGTTLTVRVAVAQDLPTDPVADSFEIEPPILVPNLERDLPPQRGARTAEADTTAPADVNIEKLEIKLKLAEKSAASAERLYKGGVLSQVEAENRALRPVRLEADITNARVELARKDVDAARARLASGEISTHDVDLAQAALAQAEEAARLAVEARQHAELAAARHNLERQKKLLALGSGGKSAVRKAEEKLASLQIPQE